MYRAASIMKIMLPSCVNIPLCILFVLIDACREMIFLCLKYSIISRHASIRTKRIHNGILKYEGNSPPHDIYCCIHIYLFLIAIKKDNPP